VDSSLSEILLNGGIAGVFCVLFVIGIIVPKWVVDDLRKERDSLKDAVSSERARADSAVAAAEVTKELFTALQAQAGLNHPPARRQPGRRQP
jgi:hypothetical protein